jgi:hypothetical protein
MKKLIISFSIILVSIAVSAQETSTETVLTSKKGIPILPKAGDFAIGVDAIPFLEYAGNMFNNTDGNSLDMYDQTIYGRYFLTDNSAIRARLSINSYSDLSQEYITDQAAVVLDPLSQAQVIDRYKYNYSYYSLNVGYIKFRGYGRLKGFYGASVGYSYSRSKSKYEFGNAITGINTTPNTYWSVYDDDARLLESDNGIYNDVSLGFIAGVEYYILPKVCIGGELTVAAYHGWKTQGNSKYERWTGSSVEEIDRAYSPKGRTETGIYTENMTNLTGGLYLMFHF